jgi:hypothetical protein
LACVYALASAAVRRDRRLSEASRDERAGHHGDRAVALLEQARKAGYFGKQSAIDHARKDPDLNALRNRADFRKLFHDLEAKARRPK